MLNLHQTLLEIAEKIEIVSIADLTADRNFTVRHPDYPAPELAPDTIANLQQITPQLQTKYLTIQIQNYLYDIYVSHSLISLSKLAIAATQPAQIKNNIINGIDIDFCQQLEQSNNGHGYIDRDWQVIAETENDELIVVKDSLHLHIDPRQHLPKNFRCVEIGAVVPIYLPHNLVGQDTYITVGNAGTPNCGEIVQIYFNFTPDAALAIDRGLIPELNKLDIPFQFAILHNRAFFHRYDCGTLSIDRPDYPTIQPFLANIYRSHQTEFAADIPLFSQQLAPGLGLVEVPTISSNVGMQQCELIATGLLAAIKQDKTSTPDKLSIVRQKLIAAGIDWIEPDSPPAKNLLKPNSYVLFGQN